MGIGISYTDANGLTSAFSAQGAGDALAQLRAISTQSESSLSAWRAKRAAQAAQGGGFDSSVNKSKAQRDAEREARETEQREKGYARFSGMTYKQWKAQRGENALDKKKDAGGIIEKAKAVKDLIKKIVGFNGALEAKFDKLVLKGESTARSGGIFGKNLRGVFGFFGLDSFDEPKLGRNISNALDTDEEAQGGDKKANEVTPWCEDYITRVFCAGGVQDSSETKTTPMMLYVGYRNRRMTAGGREFSLGEEHVIPVCDLSGIADIAAGKNGCFEPIYDTNKGEYTIINPYYRVGGKTYEAGVDGASIVDGAIMALEIDATAASPTAELVAVDGMTALSNMEADLRHFVIPLYIVSGGKITCDFRKGAIAVMSEF